MFEILLKDMTMKSLDRQLKFKVLVMLNVEICARVNIPIYCTKLADFSMQNLAVAGVLVAHIGIVM